MAGSRLSSPFFFIVMISAFFEFSTGRKGNSIIFIWFGATRRDVDDYEAPQVDTPSELMLSLA